MTIENNELKNASTEVRVSWDEVTNKPTRFAPIDHEHDILWSEVIGKPTEFTPEYHTHDEYAKRYHKHTIQDIIGLEGLSIGGGSGDGSTDHNHDIRYYTKQQVDEKLLSKADADHTHSIEDLAGLDGVLDCYKQYYVDKDTMIQDDDDFFICQVRHNLESKLLDVKVKDTNYQELLADVTTISENRIEVLTDVKEDLIIFIKKLNLINEKWRK